MAEKTAILLNSKWENQLTVGGELAWVIKDVNPSTGYTWQFTPDNSGVYELVETVTLHASVQAVGVPGAQVWKFKAVQPGAGAMLFTLHAPGTTQPVEQEQIHVGVK